MKKISFPENKGLNLRFDGQSTENASDLSLELRARAEHLGKCDGRWTEILLLLSYVIAPTNNYRADVIMLKN